MQTATAGNARDGIAVVALRGVISKSTKGPDMYGVEADGTYWAHMPARRWDVDTCDLCGCNVGWRNGCWVSRKGAVRCELHGVRKVTACK